MVRGFGQLVGAVRRGDEYAFGLLWRATTPTLLRYLRVVVPGRADEVAAATWRDLVHELRRFRGTEAQWRTLVLATGRRRARRAVPVPGQVRPSAVAMKNWRLDEVVTALSLELLAVLPPAQRDVLVLRTVGGLPVARVARIMRFSQPTVRTASRDGLARASLLVAPSAAVSGPMPSDTTIENLFAGIAVPPSASSRTKTIAAIIVAAGAPPTPDEAGHPGPAYAAFRAEFGAGRRSPTPSLWLGPRAAVAAAITTVALSGTLTAAYGGALPDSMQKVAHDWLHAPAPDGRGPVHRPSDGTTPSHRQGSGRTAEGVPSSGRRSGHRSEAPRGSAKPSPAATRTPPPGAPHAAPGATKTPPGSTKTPPGSTKTPPGSTKTPPGSTKTPPGSTKTPPGSTKTPPGSTKTPPGSTKTAPGSTKTAPGSTKTPPGRAKANTSPGRTKSKAGNRPAQRRAGAQSR